MASNMTRNPGVGLKLTSQRISVYNSVALDTPSPQSYCIRNGILDLTEREKKQNALLSNRYEKKKRASTNDPKILKRSNPVVDSFPIRPPSQKKNSRPTSQFTKPVKSISTSTGFYSIPGMADLSEREMNRNKLLSNRYI